MARNLTVVLASTLLLAGASIASAQQPQPPLSDAWRWTHFTVDQGLPSSAVVAAVQVPGGALWAVTRLGVARFDGFQWRRVQLPGPDDFVHTQILPGSHGDLAVIHAGSLISVDRDGAIQVELSPESGSPTLVGGGRGDGGPLLLLGLDGLLYEWDGDVCRRHAWQGVGRVTSLAQAGPGRVWVSGERGLACWDGRQWHLRMSTTGPPHVLLGVLENADESAWVSVERPLESRGVWYFGHEHAIPVRRPAPSPIVSFGRTADGRLLAVHGTGDLTWLDDARWSPVATPRGLLADARSVNVLSSGDVAIATDDGLYLYAHASDRWTVTATVRPDDGNSVNEVKRGPDGAIYLATATNIARLGADGWLERVAPPASGVSSLTGLEFDRQGRLWIGSGLGFRGPWWRDGTGWHRFSGDPLLEQVYIHRILSDRSGGLWFLGLSQDADRLPEAFGDAPGAFRLGPDGRVTRWGVAEGLPSGRVYAFDEGPDGSYWFGTVAGLSRWKAGHWRHWTVADGLRTSKVFVVAVDARGTAWFGHQARGLGRIERDIVSYVSASDGLVDDRVWSVKADALDRIWVGTEGGVSVRQDGLWTSFDPQSGLPVGRVWPILPERDRAYIGTLGMGLVVLKLSEPSPPPLVSTQRAIVEGNDAVVRWKAFAWQGEMPTSLVPTRLRLDDGAWSGWTTAREHRFTNLPAGEHRVLVQAKGLLGALAPVGAPIVLTIQPPLFERPAVFVPIGLLSLIIAGLLVFIGLRQRRHHLELHEREERFTRVFQESPLPTTVSRWEDGAFLDVNPAFERLTGRSRGDILEQRVTGLDFLDVYDREHLLRQLDRERTLRAVPLRLLAASGPIEVLGYFQATRLNGRRVVLTQCLDVSEQHRLEAQLRQAQKMESVGRLAGGVAHDFNNLLTVILGNVELLDAALPAGDRRRQETEQVRIAGERATALTRQLLAFARKQVVEPRVIQLNDIVLRTDLMLRRLIGEDIELVTMIGEVGPVLADPGQVEQVLVNMVVNARDAMPGGGTLTVGTLPVTLAEGDPHRDPDTKPGPFVRLSISDTGIGMDGATAARVFDPFFTTKEAGKGTGLGLATCYGIVKQAGGQILVESEPGRGTTFHVDLPRATEPAAEETREDEWPPARRDGRESVLVVEDEVQVRRLAAGILRNRGYEVFEAADGAEALEVSGGFAGRIDLLLTDVVMPGMRGTEVARRLAAARPGLRVLYMSGYTDDERFRQEAGTSDFEFMAKPFTPTVLARRVREVLDRADV
jgi:PAS domain S-box-containing protein